MFAHHAAVFPFRQTDHHDNIPFMNSSIYEKLGQFYLGCEMEPDGKRSDRPLLYDSRDMTTHGVCVGMTGSGKTGLCLALLEEAAMDGIPALIVDPKGDLGNLALTFPQMRGEDFAPWINEEDARKAGVNMEAFAEREAEKWKAGLADWGQTPERIAALREKADIAIFTPGSTAGIPLSLLRSFAAPDKSLTDDPELLAERIQSTTAGLLALLGIDADPLRSREYSLLAAILQDAWSKENSPDLAELISLVQNPPFATIGVLALEDFFPAKQRTGLILALNNLLASPGFSAWREGQPLDIASLLHTSTGKPRLAILSIAHLSDAERMFFVTTLLQELIAWMRRQPGTPSLRALFYMDEIFGYLPPIANPPSKGPLLLLLKQARAFGLGLLFATQNPADLDYKALSNCGTWFIGRLQTDRDKQRVLEGLESASAGAGANRTALTSLLEGLGKRIFLLNSIHLTAPVTFQTRWTMSYLRGPLTRDQIRTLTDPIRPAVSIENEPPTRERAATTDDIATSPEPPTVESGIWQLVTDATATTLFPSLGFKARATFSSRRPIADATADVLISIPLGPKDSPAWKNAVVAGSFDAAKSPVAHGGALFADAPVALLSTASHGTWKMDARQQLEDSLEITVLRFDKTIGTPFENEIDFRRRLEQGAREQRDAEVHRLREKYATKSSAAAAKIARLRETVAQQQSQATAAKLQTAISFGTTILGALFGGKKLGVGNITRAGTAARGVTRVMKESSDVGTAQERLAAAQADAEAIENEIQSLLANIPSPSDVASIPVETLRLKLAPATLRIESSGILWVG